MTWTVLPSLPADDWWGIAVGGGAIYASDKSGVSSVQKSVDNGVSWAPTGAVDLDFLDITRSNDTGFIYGVQNPNRNIWRSADGGDNWTCLGPSRNWYAIDATYGVAAYAVVYGGGIWKSDDNGDTWSECISAGSRSWVGVTTTPSGTVYAIEYGGAVYSTTDAGATWVLAPFSGAHAFFRMRATPNGTLVSSQLYSSSVWVSKDSGTVWTDIADDPTLPTRGFYAIGVESDHSILFSGSSQQLWRWVAPTPTAPTIYPPSGEYKGLIYAGITAPDGFIRFTTDGTDPTETSEIYTRGIRVAGPMTIKAVAELDGLLSTVTTATYTVTNADVSRIPSYPDAIMPLVLEQYKADNR